jgi:hypothetical protein
MIHIGSLIEQELRRQDRSVTWFAAELRCDRTNVYKVFKKKIQKLFVSLRQILKQLKTYKYENYQTTIQDDAIPATLVRNCRLQ